MKDNFDYLSLYPKSFLEAFGYQTREQRAERATRRAATKMMKGLKTDAHNAELLRVMKSSSFKRTHCKYKHSASLHGFINSEGYQRCRVCIRKAQLRYERSRKRA